MKHTVVALMQDHPGVLNRAVSLFRRRGFNIESMAVGHSETPGISRMTLVVDAEDVEQVIKQLHRLIEVLKVSDVTGDPTVEREMALLKIHAPSARRAEIVALTTIYEAKIMDVGASTMIICRFSSRGICSTLMVSPSSRRIRSSTLMPRTWWAISRPRNRRVTLTLSPSPMKPFICRIFTS